MVSRFLDKGKLLAFLTVHFLLAQSNIAISQDFTSSAPTLVSLKKMTFTISDSAPRSESIPVYTGNRPVFLFETKWIQANGYITSETPEDFKRFIRQEICQGRTICLPTPHGISTVGLNSLGGSLAAGLELGKLIRQYGFDTSITATQLGPDQIDQPILGRCLSACGYAFLGGRHRRIDFYYTSLNWADLSGGRDFFGLHRFWDSSKNVLPENATYNEFMDDISKDCLIADIEARTQCIDAVLIKYITDMGVDSRYFNAAVVKGKGKFYYLDNVSLKRLNVLNETPFTVWKAGPPRFRSSGIDIYSESINPDNKAVFVRATCLDESKRQLTVIFGTKFDPYANNEISKSTDWIFKTVNSNHFQSNKNIKIETVKSRYSDTGTIVHFVLNAENWAKIFPNHAFEMSIYPLKDRNRSVWQAHDIVLKFAQKDANAMNGFVTKCSRG